MRNIISIQPMTVTRFVVLLFVIPELLFVAWLFFAALRSAVRMAGF